MLDQDHRPCAVKDSGGTDLATSEKGFLCGLTNEDQDTQGQITTHIGISGEPSSQGRIYIEILTIHNGEQYSMDKTNDAADKEYIIEEMKIQKSMEKPLTFDEDGK